jgi:hypothetical protein
MARQTVDLMDFVWLGVERANLEKVAAPPLGSLHEIMNAPITLKGIGTAGSMAMDAAGNAARATGNAIKNNAGAMVRPAIKQVAPLGLTLPTDATLRHYAPDMGLPTAGQIGGGLSTTDLYLGFKALQGAHGAGSALAGSRVGQAPGLLGTAARGVGSALQAPIKHPGYLAIAGIPAAGIAGTVGGYNKATNQLDEMIHTPQEPGSKWQNMQNNVGNHILNRLTDKYTGQGMTAKDFALQRALAIASNPDPNNPEHMEMHRQLNEQLQNVANTTLKNRERLPSEGTMGPEPAPEIKSPGPMGPPDFPKPTLQPQPTPPKEPGFLDNIPNWGKGLGVAGGALAAGMLANNMSAEDEDPETGRKKSRTPWLGPLAGAGALGLGAYALKGDRPWSDLATADFWKQSSDRTIPMVMVPYRLKLAALPPITGVTPPIPAPVPQTTPQPPTAPQMAPGASGAPQTQVPGTPSPTQAPTTPTAAPKPTAPAQAPPAMPLASAPSAKPAVPSTSSDQNGTPLKGVPAGQPGLSGPTGQPTPTTPQTQTQPQPGAEQAQTEQQQPDPKQIASTLGAGLAGSNPAAGMGGPAAAAGNTAIVNRLAQRALELNPQAADPNTGINNLAKGLAEKGLSGSGLWDMVKEIWGQLPKEMRWLVGAGLGIGALGLLGTLTGSETFGGGTGALLGLGGLAAAAYGSGMFDSNSGIRQGLSTYMNTPSGGEPTPNVPTPGSAAPGVTPNTPAGATAGAPTATSMDPTIKQLAQDPMVGRIMKFDNNGLSLRPEGREFVMNKQNDGALTQIYDKLTPPLRQQLRGQVQQAQQQLGDYAKLGTGMEWFARKAGHIPDWLTRDKLPGYQQRINDIYGMMNQRDQAGAGGTSPANPIQPANQAGSQVGAEPQAAQVPAEQPAQANAQLPTAYKPNEQSINTLSDGLVHGDFAHPGQWEGLTGGNQGFLSRHPSEQLAVLQAAEAKLPPLNEKTPPWEANNIQSAQGRIQALRSQLVEKKLVPLTQQGPEAQNWVIQNSDPRTLMAMRAGLGNLLTNEPNPELNQLYNKLTTAQIERMTQGLMTGTNRDAFMESLNDPGISPIMREQMLQKLTPEQRAGLAEAGAPSLAPVAGREGSPNPQDRYDYDSWLNKTVPGLHQYGNADAARSFSVDKMKSNLRMLDSNQLKGLQQWIAERMTPQDKQMPYYDPLSSTVGHEMKGREVFQNAGRNQLIGALSH